MQIITGSCLLCFRKARLLLSTAVLFFSAFVNEAASQSIRTVYLTKGDTLHNMYLMVSPPDTVKRVAFMFLIPAFNETPADVPVQTRLPIDAAENGVVTFIPILATGVTSFAVDDSTQRSLKTMIEHCVQAYRLEGLPFYIGGFSLGGTCAVKYAELAVKDNYAVKPAAVFGVDPPLDFERFYNAAKRNLRLMQGIYQNPELTYFSKRIEEKFGGTPATALQQYYKYSPYSFSDTSQSAVKLLRRTPVTFYAEPEVNWWMRNHAFDYTNINVIDEAAMINELHLLGNYRNARLVITENKGYRMPGKIKNPHSWSILDPEDLVAWLKTNGKSSR